MRRCGEALPEYVVRPHGEHDGAGMNHKKNGQRSDRRIGETPIGGFNTMTSALTVQLP